MRSWWLCVCQSRASPFTQGLLWLSQAMDSEFILQHHLDSVTQSAGIVMHAPHARHANPLTHTTNQTICHAWPADDSKKPKSSKDEGNDDSGSDSADDVDGDVVRSADAEWLRAKTTAESKNQCMAKNTHTHTLFTQPHLVTLPCTDVTAGFVLGSQETKQTLGRLGRELTALATLGASAFPNLMNQRATVLRRLFEGFNHELKVQHHAKPRLNSRASTHAVPLPHHSCFVPAPTRHH